MLGALSCDGYKEEGARKQNESLIKKVASFKWFEQLYKKVIDR